MPAIELEDDEDGQEQELEELEEDDDAGVLEESSSDSEEDEGDSDELLLGFLEAPVHPELMLRHHFPCKVGGKPAWLNPMCIPPLSAFACARCQKPMKFLLQINACLEFDEAFHRSLLLFLCPNLKCLPEGGLAVFRSQLPRVNPFYPYKAAPDPPTWEGALVEFDEEPLPSSPHLCAVCGLPGPKSCGQCKKVHYCSQEHQRLHWKPVHSALCTRAANTTTTTAATSASTSTPSTTSLSSSCSASASFLNTISDEKKQETTTETTTTSSTSTSRFKVRPSLGGVLYQEREIVIEPDEEEEKEQIVRKPVIEGEDASFNSRDWKKLNKNKLSKQFTLFQATVGKAPEQVLRYQRGGKCLWVSTERQLESAPPCPSCKGPRVFEFQVLPQLLFYLGETASSVEESRGALDWGTLAVYTCEKSCGDGLTAYFPEHVHFQPHEQ